MRSKKYSCPNGCKLPPRRKVLQESKDHTYKFDYNDFLFCPVCGSLMPYSLDKIRDFFDVYHVHSSLKRAINLVYKSEFEAAARETFVVVETTLKKKSGLDLHGFDLATKALSFEFDKKTGKIRADLICFADEVYDISQDLLLFDPIDTWKKTRLTGGSYTMRELLVPVFRNGECVYQSPSVMEIAEYCRQEKETLWDETKRLFYPHRVYVDLSQKLFDVKNSLLERV